MTAPTKNRDNEVSRVAVAMIIEDVAKTDWHTARDVADEIFRKYRVTERDRR